MTQDEIIRMALEADCYKTETGALITDNVDLERFAALVAAHEREKQAEQKPMVKPMNKAERENWYKEVIAATEDVIAEKERIAEHRALITRNNAIIAASQQPVKELELTDDEIWEIEEKLNRHLREFPIKLARAVIAADRKLNK